MRLMKTKLLVALSVTMAMIAVLPAIANANAWFVMRGAEQKFLSEFTGAETEAISFTFPGANEITFGSSKGPIKCKKLKSKEAELKQNVEGQLKALEFEECKYAGVSNCELENATIVSQPVEFRLEGVSTIKFKEGSGGKKFLSYKLKAVPERVCGGNVEGENELLFEKNGGGAGEIKGSLAAPESLELARTITFAGAGETILKIKTPALEEAGEFSGKVEGAVVAGRKWATRPKCGT